MTKRTSEKRIIEDREKYDQLIDVYFSLLTTLESDFPITSEPMFEELVNFQLNKEVPKHNWFEYKQGYSDELIRQLIIRNNPSPNSFILDPFTGVGTTNLTAQEMGYQSIGIDINPVSILVARVKTYSWHMRELQNINQLLEEFSPPYQPGIVPKLRLLDKSFAENDFQKLMAIKGFYESIENTKISQFFKVAYLSILERVSNRVKDGNGLKYARGKERIEDVYEYYLFKCSKMLDDIRKTDNNHSVNAIISNISILDTELFFANNKFPIELAIFSPPYANCFDYFEVYKLEMWMGGFVNKYNDFDEYRNKAIRSHVNSSFDHQIRNFNSKVDLIAELISSFNIWNKNIPDMIRGYFDDMTDVLSILYDQLSSGGKCYIIVANSGYRGILVPTDLLLSDISYEIGFNVRSLKNARMIRSSSQQMKILKDKYRDLMRETIIELTK